VAEFELKALITGVDRLSPTLSRMQKKIRGFRKDTEALGRGGIAMAGGLAAGLTGSLVAFAKQEDAATGLKVAMMDAAGQAGPAFGKINDLAVKLGNKLPGTTADFQNMMQMLVRQGIPAENILNGVGKASAYLAVQLKKTPEAAAEFAAKMQDATGTASEDMMGLFDTIQKAFYLGVDDTNMLSFFSKSSSVLKMISKDGLTAARALVPISVMMDQMGMQGEASGNAVRKIFQAGFDSKKVGAANALLAKKKIKLDFTDGKGEFGGIDNLFNQLKKLQSLTTKQRTTIIKKIFGDDAETLQVLNALIDKGREGYEQVQKKMASQASLNQRVEAQLGTLANLWEALTGTAVNGLAAIGGAFAGDVKKTTLWLGDLADRFSEFAAKNPAVIRGAFGMAAAFVAVKVAALGINFALGLISKTISLSPFGIFIRVAALAAGLIIANWSTIGPWFQKLWKDISGFFTENYALIKTAIENFSPLEYIAEKWEPVAKWFEDLWARIQPYIDPIMNGIDKIKGLASAGKNWLFGDDNEGGGEPPSGSLPVSFPPVPGSMNNDFMRMQQTRTQGNITVDFREAPPGTVVKTSDSQGMNITTDVGYNRFSKQ